MQGRYQPCFVFLKTFNSTRSLYEDDSAFLLIISRVEPMPKGYPFRIAGSYMIPIRVIRIMAAPFAEIRGYGGEMYRGGLGG